MKTCKQYEGEPLQPTNAQNEELLEYCTATVPTLPHHITTITPMPHSETVWDHGEFDTSHSLHINQSCSPVLYTELVILCSHTIHIFSDEELTSVRGNRIMDTSDMDTSDLTTTNLSSPLEEAPENVYTMIRTTHVGTTI